MKVDEIYTPYKTIPIYKVIVKNQNYYDKEGVNYKLIFIGPVKDIDIRNSLQKIERNQNLTNNDDKKLKKFIPYYQKILGLDKNNTIENEEYQIKFIYFHLENNTPINHLQNIIFEYLKDDKLGYGFLSSDYEPNNQLIYKYSNNISYSRYVRILNSIFKNNHILDQMTF